MVAFVTKIQVPHEMFRLHAVDGVVLQTLSEEELQAELGLTLLQARKVASHRALTPAPPQAMLMHLVLYFRSSISNQISNQIEELVFSISIAHGVRGARESVSATRCVRSRGKRFLATIGDICPTKDMEQSVSSAMLLSRVECKALFELLAPLRHLY